MKPNSGTRRFATGVMFAAAIISPGIGQTLQDIKSGTGSEIVYGPLQGYDNLQDGMVYILKQVHGHFGDKPNLGSFFKARRGETVGTFFEVEDKNFTHQKQAGLVLVSKLTDGTVQVAVLTDKSAQFRHSINRLVTTLKEAWYRTERPRDPEVRSASVQPLETFYFPDRSGSIKLAEGWRPTIARGGGIIAVGPNGETLGASCYLGVMDSNNPQVRRSLAQGRPLPGLYAACPSTASPSDAFGYLYNQFRQKHQMGTGRVKVSVANTQHGALGTTYMLSGEFEDANGSQGIIAAMSAGRYRPAMQGWACILTTVTAPKELFERERPTLLAMANSLNQNAGVIKQQADKASGEIIEYSNRVRQETKEKGDLFDQRMAGIAAQHDNDDKRSSAFQDFLLDQSVVEHTPTGWHGRFYNDDANLLVESNPDKWQIVPGSQYIKGRDY